MKLSNILQLRVIWDCTAEGRLRKRGRIGEFLPITCGIIGRETERRFSPALLNKAVETAGQFICSLRHPELLLLMGFRQGTGLWFIVLFQGVINRGFSNIEIAAVFHTGEQKYRFIPEYGIV